MSPETLAAIRDAIDSYRTADRDYGRLLGDENALPSHVYMARDSVREAAYELADLMADHGDELLRAASPPSP